MEVINLHKELNDVRFEKIYPKYVRELSKIHWTPIDIATIAINWLAVSSHTKILDIGSGVGKFCILGGLLSNAQFTGVEKRKKLINVANKSLAHFSLNNVKFIHSNILDVNFNSYDAFYYFNPFCEQIALCDWIDDTTTYSRDKYELYEQYVIDQLAKMPIGTKLVTYCCHDFYPPNSFTIKDMMFDGQLVLWVKKGI